MDEPVEKAGLRTAWGRVAEVYQDMWAARTVPFTAAGLDLHDAPRGADGLDICCGPRDTTVALAERIAPGRARGADFAPAMVERAQARFGEREDVSFAADDAERLALPDDSIDVLTCSFGLMYCYDARGTLGEAARVLRPGGRMLQVVWGPAPAVWFVPVIALIKTPRRVLLGRVPHDVLLRAAGGPAELDDASQAEVREALTAHVESLAEPDGAGISLPAQVVAAVGRVRGG